MERITVLLLPGMHGTDTLFASLVRALPPSWTICTFAYPSEETGVTAVERVLAGWPPGENVFIVAESFSGPVAIRLAGRRPPFLRGVVLVSTFLRAPRSGLQCLSRGLGLWTPPVPPWALRRYLVGRGASAALVAEVRTAIGAMPRGTLRRRLATVAAVNVHGELGQIAVPVRLLYGTDDKLVPHRSVEEFPPSVERVPMQGAHLLLQAEPERSARAIVEFVERCLA